MDQAISPQTLLRRRRLRWLTVVAVVVGLAAVVWGLNRLIRPSLSLDDLRVSVVRIGEIANTINAAGVVIPVHEEQVSIPINTRVVQVHAKAGQEVAAGDLLLELDDQTIRLAIDGLDEQIAQQDLRVQSLTLEMQQKHKQLQSEIELLELDLESARLKLQRYQQLGKTGAFSAADLQAAELAVRRTEIELRQRRESVVDTRRATASNIEAAVLQQSILRKSRAQQENLQKQTQVRAPIAGMLAFVLSDPGATVQSGQMVARISELRNYRVEATVSDFYARYLSPGQQVRVHYSGQELGGTVQTLLPEIQNGSVTLLVSLDEPSHPLLRNKLRVDASIITEQKAGALIADSGPAFNGRGRQEVYVVADGYAEKRVLEIGLSDGQRVEIASGARSGDRLIVSDSSRYRHLDRIRVHD